MSKTNRWLVHQQETKSLEGGIQVMGRYTGKISDPMKILSSIPKRSPKNNAEADHLGVALFVSAALRALNAEDSGERLKWAANMGRMAMSMSEELVAKAKSIVEDELREVERRIVKAKAEDTNKTE